MVRPTVTPVLWASAVVPSAPLVQPVKSAPLIPVYRTTSLFSIVTYPVVGNPDVDVRVMVVWLLVIEEASVVCSPFTATYKFAFVETLDGKFAT